MGSTQNTASTGLPAESSYLTQWFREHPMEERAVRMLTSIHDAAAAVRRELYLSRLVLEREYDIRIRSVLSSRGQADTIKELPGFWATVMANHPCIRQEIADADSPLLLKLEDVRMCVLSEEECDDLGSRVEEGYRLEFEFDDPNNIFFAPGGDDGKVVLTKTIGYKRQSTGFRDLVPEVAIGTDINWAEGMDLVGTAEGTATDGTQGSRRSFFNFFSSCTSQSTHAYTDEFEKELEARRDAVVDIDDSSDDDDDDDGPRYDRWRMIEEHTDLADIFNETVVDNAVYWYTGEGRYLDGFEDEEEEEEEE